MGRFICNWRNLCILPMNRLLSSIPKFNRYTNVSSKIESISDTWKLQ